MRNREEDIEVNLTGDESTSNESGKPRWFKRIKRGITTPTADKKKPPKVYGRSALTVITLVLVRN